MAPAKINLVLSILHRRADGYHELYTVFQKISLCDRVQISLLRKPGVDKDVLEIYGDIVVPKNGGNLCLRALKRFSKEVGPLPPVKIKLYKKIPTGAGLGGGSSDAAAVLLGLNFLLNNPLSERALLRLGRDLGADVPFFIFSHPTALGRGIGDELAPWPCFKAWYVLVFPGFSISTAWAYQNLRLTSSQKPPNYEPAQPLWHQGLINDFEPVVFKKYPVLKDIKERLRQLGAVASLLSGSGATVFGIFLSAMKAHEARKEMGKQGFKAVVTTNYQEGDLLCS